MQVCCENFIDKLNRLDLIPRKSQRCSDCGRMISYDVKTVEINLLNADGTLDDGAWQVVKEYIANAAYKDE